MLIDMQQAVCRVAWNPAIKQAIWTWILKFDSPPGGSKNSPEAEGGSVRVQISLSRPVSFFMMKPRLCPIRDQLSPVQSSRL
ncbi:hypothetical protein F2Q68_00037533 [Brassica cretica]|uniref:Uncharacterized protein n=1 Tax=Brassica cretica TaxID=69181 RepID=A0A8S9GZ16_BRACR|nr:hypothetical protein F2Q68_00037533 [Brassica cretica]